MRAYTSVQALRSVKHNIPARMWMEIGLQRGE